MRHRGEFSIEERQMRSRLTQIVHQKPFVYGSLVKSAPLCGKKNCRCKKDGKGHKSYYLSVRVGGKRKMIYIPFTKVKQVQEWIGTFKEIQEGVYRISESCLRRLWEE